MVVAVIACRQFYGRYIELNVAGNVEGCRHFSKVWRGFILLFFLAWHQQVFAYRQLDDDEITLPLIVCVTDSSVPEGYHLVNHSDTHIEHHLSVIVDADDDVIVVLVCCNVERDLTAGLVSFDHVRQKQQENLVHLIGVNPPHHTLRCTFDDKLYAFGIH